MPKPTKKPTYSKKHKILPILIALLIAAPLLYLAYDTYADYRDKQRFETVRASIEELRDRLQAAAADGEQWTISASCSQGSVKFQEAAKTCFVGLSGSRELERDDNIENLIEGYEAHYLAAVPALKMEQSSTALSDAADYDTMSEINEVYIEERTGLRCFGSFKVISEEANEVKILKASLGCRDTARELYYPR